MKPIATISESFTKRRQSLVYARTLNANGAKFRISVKRDSYDFQSHGKIDRWDGDKWHRVHAVPYPDLACLEVSPYDRSPDRTPFEEDAAALYRVAMAVTEA